VRVYVERKEEKYDAPRNIGLETGERRDRADRGGLDVLRYLIG